MTVKLVIKTPPAPPGPVHSVYVAARDGSSTTIYVTPPNPHVFNPLINLPPGNLPAQSPAVGLSYIRNNRLVGYFADVIQTRLEIERHISREIEYGSDI